MFVDFGVYVYFYFPFILFFNNIFVVRFVSASCCFFSCRFRFRLVYVLLVYFYYICSCNFMFVSCLLFSARLCDFILF